jgi:membrane-associated phospholipid phosphatase
VRKRSLTLIIGSMALALFVPAAFAEESNPGPGNILTDLFHDVRFLPGWENAWWLLAGVGVTGGVHEIEDADGARRALDRGIIDPVVDAGNVYGDIRVQAPVAVAVWAYGRALNDAAASSLGYDLVRALSLNYTLTGAMKPAFNRTRPNGEDYSFPSGHTSAAFATAGVVSRHHGPWWTGAAIGAGVLTGLGRMEDLKHYASDVTAGATLGWIIGRTVARDALGGEPSIAGGSWRITPSLGGAILCRRF